MKFPPSKGCKKTLISFGDILLDFILNYIDSTSENEK